VEISQLSISFTTLYRNQQPNHISRR